MQQIKFLAATAGMSLKKAKETVHLLEKTKAVEINYTIHDEMLVQQLREYGFLFTYPESYLSWPFDQEKTIAYLEETIVPYLENHVLLFDEPDSYSIFDQKFSTMLLVENSAENKFMAEYLLKKGIRVIKDTKELNR